MIARPGPGGCENFLAIDLRTHPSKGGDETPTIFLASPRATLATACGAPGRPTTLELSGFVEAGEGYHYEAWLELEDGPVSILQFDGSEVRIDFEIEETTPESAGSARFSVTLQPDDASEPSAHTRADGATCLEVMFSATSPVRGRQVRCDVEAAKPLS